MLTDPLLAESGDLVLDPDDGLPARAVHEWSKDKHFYLGAYMDIFATSMKNRWDHRVYLDLLAGPGRCYELESQAFYDGSPLLAFTWPFTQHIYVELNPLAAQALEARCEQLRGSRQVGVLQGDCNRRIEEVVALLPQRDTLVFAFLDPTNWQVRFDTVRRLALRRQVDIVLTFMVGMMKRVHSGARELDLFFGTDAWRRPPYLGADGMPSSDGLLACYSDQLTEIGYLPLPTDQRPVTILGPKRAPLYMLAFFSKHALGYSFWEKVTRRDLAGQMVLPL